MAFLVSCTQICADKVPVTPGEVAMVDLLGGVVELMSVQMFRPGVCFPTVGCRAFIFLVECLDHATLLLGFGLC